MKTPTRIYAVTDNCAATATVHLVRATSQAQAIRHIASARYTATVASQDELVEMVTLGAAVYDATTTDGPAHAEQHHA